MRVGICQINTKRLNLEHNFNKSIKLIKKAAKKGAKIIVTGECMLDGYGFDKSEFQENPQKYSVSIDDEKYIVQYKILAKELGVYLIIGVSLKESAKGPVEQMQFRNTALLINPEGEIQGQYHKVHSTFGNLEAKFYSHGKDFPVFEVEIDAKKVILGIMICYDRQMPETARILALRGAQIIFNPAATGNFARKWNTRLIQTRSYENGVFIFSINHAYPRIRGLSFATNPQGKIIARCWPFEGIKIVDIDPETSTIKRKRLETRRPSVYGALLESTRKVEDTED